jgi:FK506-binding protein 4/5
LRSESDNKKSWQLKFAVQLNLALCYLKLGNYEECKRACNSALAFDSKNEKALFRRGQCQLASRNFDEAIEDFQTVLKFNPSNVAAKQQIQQCQQEIKAHQVKEKELYHSFLNRTAKTKATHKVSNIPHQNKCLNKQFFFF